MEDPGVDKKLKEKVKDEIQKSSYVICSTLNQMVNYIPIKLFNFKEIFNITIEKRDESRYFDNSLWDENLKEAVKKDITDIISIPQSQMGKINVIKDALQTNKHIKNKTCVWNITGGQRYIVIAILDYVRANRPRDFICYLEGNKNKLVFIRDGKQVMTDTGYSIEDDSFNIDTALNLAGFNTKVTATTYPNLLKTDQETLKEENIYIKLFNLYMDTNNGLRAMLINTNAKDAPENLKSEIGEF